MYIFITIKIIHIFVEAGEDGLLGKVLATQSGGPEFDPQNSHKKPARWLACHPSSRGGDRSCSLILT